MLAMNRRLMDATRRLMAALTLSLVLAAPLAAQNVTLNLKDADIRSVIETIAELTGRSFIVDPRVQGKVTVVTSRQMSTAQVYEVFLSILELNGFTAVDSGQVTKIIPAAGAKTSPTPLVSDPDAAPGDAEVSRVIELDSVRAAELVPLLRPLLPQEGHLAAHNSSNVLIISGKAGNVARLEQVIRRIDQDGDSEVEIVRLRHASAGEVVKMLASLQDNLGKGAAGAPTSGLGLRFVADARSNSVILSGDRTQRLSARALIVHLDTPLETSGNIRVLYLHYAKAADVAKVLQGIVESERKEQQKEGVRAAGDATLIQPDETTNALVIHADPERLRALEDVVRQLDIRRAQVLVEGIIAETSAGKSSELGVQWSFISNAANNSGGVAGTNFDLTGQGLNTISRSPATLGDGLSLGYLDGTISVLGTEILNIGALLRALASDADTNILATPTLVTMDNAEAEIVVAQNVPFLTGQYANTGATTPGVNPFQTIERQDVGLTLRLTPQINEGDAIKMKIEQEVSNLSNATNTGAVDLITVKRQIRTNVIVDDGKLIVLGGLIDDNLRQGVSKVPLLGDIPGLGALFRYRSDQVEKRNLMIFLRPEIMRDGETSQRVSLDKYNLIRNEQLRQREREGMLLEYPDKPLLPEAETR
ncbi:MAG: type II secretion system secretin GspD [Gammaproteobacteria bacterium]|nr:type II secretion system secretin GspD [Gammaproteobacteria bacterium]